MKLFKIAVSLITVSAALTLTNNAHAVLYDFTFNGDGSSASGQIDLVGGVAVSGTLDVTSGNAQGTYSLYTWNGGGISSIRVDGGTDLIVDNLVDVNSRPSLDVYGLAFVSSSYTGGHPSEGIDLSLNYGTTYNLAGFGIDGYCNPNANGSVFFDLVPFPEPTTGAIILLCLGISSMMIFRRRKGS